ncbi:hypothetical protein FI667_g11727, partial [Globisporangium splendens]
MEFVFRDDDEAPQPDVPFAATLDVVERLCTQDDSQDAFNEGIQDDDGEAMIHEQIPLFELSTEDLVAISSFVDDETATMQPSKQLRGPVSHQIKVNITWDPNRARNRRKGELIYLRNLVVELETQLCSIKAKRSKKFRSMGSSSTALRQLGSLPTNTRIPVQTWWDIARRQGDERARSERENVRLKLLLEKQLKVARHLERFLARMTSRKDMSDVISPSYQPPRMAFIPRDCRSDADIFDDLATGIPDSYAEIDAIFDANGLSQMESAYSDAQIHYDHQNGAHLEVFANHILPFDLHSTGAAVWDHFSATKERLPHRAYHYEFPRKANIKYLRQHIDATENTIIESFHLSLYSRSKSATFRVHQIFQRYIEANRIVVVWRASIETVEFAESPVPPGLRFLKKGYLILKKPSSENLIDYTLLQPCYVITPVCNTDEWISQNSLNASHKDLAKFMLQATATNVSATSELLETTLLAQSRQGQAR